MNDEQNQRMRVVGQINALNELAKVTQCMREDRKTVKHLEKARILINKALLSAWEFADALPARGINSGD